MQSCIKVLIAAIAALVVSSAALAAEASATKVNGVQLPQYRFESALKAEVAQGQKDSPELRQMIRDVLINQEVVSQDAIKKGLDKQPDTAARLDAARFSVLADAYFDRYFAEHPIPDEVLRKEYERLKTQAPKVEYHMRDIVVASEAEANDIIAQLNTGVAFEKLAAERSQDAGTKQRGGDLGWGPVERFPKPIADAVRALKPGDTTAPLRTNSGYLVLRLEEERPATIATFDEAKAQVQQFVRAEVVRQVVVNLRAQARIEP